MYRGRLTLRKLSALVENLPPGAALWRSIDPDGQAWSDTDHLLALVVDVLRGANWQRAGDPKAARPEPIPRPGDAKKAEQRRQQQVEAFLRTRTPMRMEGGPQ